MLLPVGVAENEQTQFETQLIAFRHDANWSVCLDTPLIPDSTAMSSCLMV